MKLSCKSVLIISALLVLMTILVLPVSAFVASATSAAPVSTGSAAPASNKSTISATVSAATPTVGDDVTISGVATGSTPVSSVQIWVFAGGYINFTTVPVNPDGTYSKTYQTSALPPAIYYVFVQSPGNDGKFGISLDKSGKYSGQIVDNKDGSLLLNMTGTGSVQDAAASVALSDALNKRGGDDVYTKTTVQLVAPGTAAPATPAAVVTSAAPAPVATAKSSLSPLTLFAGIGLCCAAFQLARK
jgi:hypothetical protein